MFCDGVLDDLQRGDLYPDAWDLRHPPQHDLLHLRVHDVAVDFLHPVFVQVDFGSNFQTSRG